MSSQRQAKDWLVAVGMPPTSEEVMPWTALLLRPKLRAAQLSKSLSMCSWTLEGSLVPSTLSNSSSEMKKNLQGTRYGELHASCSQ